MTKVKSLAICLLACILTTTTSISSYASVNGTGDGEESGTSTPEIVGSFHAYHVNQGTRMTIVNSEGIAVSNSVDFVNYFPEDIEYGTKISSEAMNYMWNNYKINTGSDRNTPKKYIQYLGGCKTDMVYALSELCLLDKSIANNFEKAIDSSRHGLMTITRKNNDYTQNGSVVGNFGFKESKMYTYSLLEKMLNKDAEKFGYTNPIDGSTGTFTYTTSMGEQRTVSKQFKPPMIEGITSTGVPGLLTTGEEMKQQLMAPVEYINNGVSNKDTIIQRIIEMDGYDADGRGNQLSGNMVRVFEYIDPKLKSQYDEIVASGKGNPMSTVFQANNLRLLIEPVCWMVGGVASPTDPRPNRRGAGMEMSFNTPYVIYGTVTNAYQYIAQQFDRYCEKYNLYADKPSINDWNTWINWTGAKGLGFSWEWGLHTKGYRIENDEIGLGLSRFNPDTQNTLQNLLRYYPSLGYGVMVTTLDELGTGTPTWDNITYPESSYQPGPAPDKSSITTEGEDYKKTTYPDGKVKDKNFNIVKFYATKDSSGNYNYIENHTRTQTLHNITLNDEPGYKVDNWFTSLEFKEPQSESDSYDEYKDTVPNGDQSGTSSGTISIPSTSADNTLYMRLVSDEGITVGNETTIKIPLYENEVSKQVSLSSISENRYRQVVISLPAIPPNKFPSRDYQEKFKQGANGGWKATYHYVNSSLQSSDSNTVAKVSPFEIIDSNNNFTQSAVQGRSITRTQGAFNSKFTIWRGEDRPTIASYKPETNDNTKSELKVLGLKEGNSPQDNRAIDKEKGMIEKAFDSMFTVAGDSDTTLETLWDWRDGYTKSCSNHSNGHWRWSPDWHGWEAYEDKQAPTPATTLLNILAKEYIYLGKPNTGDKQSSDNSISFKIPVQTLAGGTDNREFTGKGTAIQTSQAITLYPYVQMKYNTTQDSTWKNTYTLSNYLSTIHNTDFVDLAYSKTKSTSLELNSSQWSTHSRSIKAVGKDNALPGGALHNLSTPDENSTMVALRIFQTVTPDSIQPALQSGYDYYSLSAAHARRDNLINQVTESLSNLSIVQYINEGITKDLKQLTNGIMLNSEGGQTVFKNTTSRDSKYFFKFAKTQADGGAINIKKSDDITETIYNISSFTDGTVKIKRDGVDLLTLGKTEDISKILSNPELKELDDKTKFFTNFLLAIDRNVGADKNGQTWYNEAIDSMELHIYTQIFTLGFNEPFSTRSSVLDPKLIGYQASKADLYNYDDENKVRSSVYLTYGKPTNQTQDGVFATWGDNNVNIILPRLPYLFQSKIFYIPNATVQDLN